MSHLLRRGLLVVERNDYGSNALVAVHRDPFSGISARQALERYAGIDGKIWPSDPGAAGIGLERGLAPPQHLDRVRMYFRSLRPKGRCDLLVVDREPRGSVPEPPDIRFLGYDFGFLEGEYNCYSFLRQEIIYPRFEELAEFASRLNQNLLLESVGTAEEISAARESLEASGERFETTDSPEVSELLAVFAYTD